MTRATKLYNWQTAGVVAFVLLLVGIIIVVGTLTGEYWVRRSLSMVGTAGKRHRSQLRFRAEVSVVALTRQDN